MSLLVFGASGQVALELARVGSPGHSLGRGRRQGPANFGVRYLHGGRDLYAACSTPQDGVRRTITPEEFIEALKK